MFNTEDFIPHALDLNGTLIMIQVKVGDPNKRPTAADVYEKLQDWEIILDKNIEELNKEQIEIRDAFLKADKNLKELNKDLIENKTDKITSALSK
ncbi:3567_t:CDS:2, partial [Dentiscutata heterogama]